MKDLSKPFSSIKSVYFGLNRIGKIFNLWVIWLSIFSFWKEKSLSGKLEGFCLCEVCERGEDCLLIGDSERLIGIMRWVNLIRRSARVS
jgi:hypothetical protein